jgi:6-pyruvoyltetrahydropterin/6-carboxytetrahydropterin synthase
VIYELSQRFDFEAAHTLERSIDAAPSRRIHGHTYHAEVTLRGVPEAGSGMLVDLGHFRRVLAEVKDLLDHHLLNEVEGLTKPTLEGLCAFIAGHLQQRLPGLAAVSVWRASGDRCRLVLAGD